MRITFARLAYALIEIVLYLIYFKHLKLSVAVARHNFKLAKTKILYLALWMLMTT